MMAEPAVSLTDYLLCLESTVIVTLLVRVRAVNTRLQRWLVLFFFALGLAALAGGTSHGFLQDQHPQLDAIAWSVTLLAIGMVGLSGWNISACLVGDRRLARLIAVTAALLFAAYVPVVLFVDTRFVVAVLYYLPATLFLLLLLVWRYSRTGHGWILHGIAGLVLALVAAAVQQIGFVIHPVWLDHNVLYHLIQAVAMLLIYLFARHAIQSTE